LPKAIHWSIFVGSIISAIDLRWPDDIVGSLENAVKGKVPAKIRKYFC